VTVAYVKRARRSGRPWRRMRAFVLLRDHHRCHWCGGHADVVDHVVPRALGGSDFDPRNLVASCTPCNQRRAARLTKQLGFGYQRPRFAGPRIRSGAIGGD